MDIYYGKNYIRQILGEEFLVEGDIKSKVVGDAPEELDTFGEVAEAVQSNSESIEKINEAIEKITTEGVIPGEDWEAMDNIEIQDVVDSIFE